MDTDQTAVVPVPGSARRLASVRGDRQPESCPTLKENFMSSKTYKKKMIRKWKQRAHKANIKADQKRIDKNHAVLYPKDPVADILS